MGEGILYLGILAGILLAGCAIGAAGLWVLYRINGGRRGLVRWIRDM